MPATNQRLIGINEVGHVVDPDSTATDTPWGNTQQSGVELQLTTETVELQSGQATMKESVNLVTAAMVMAMALVVAELTAFGRIWGLPDSAFTGDLEDTTPTDEILSITTGNMGTEERALYILGPGPETTRRVDARRCRVSDLGNLSFASNAFQTPDASWEVLVPQGDTPPDPVIITDAAA